MNDNELERRLRSESGPREQGYEARALPASPESKENRRRGNVLRVAVIAPAVAAGIMAVAIGGALLSAPRGSNNGVGEGPTSTPTPLPRYDGERANCIDGDLVFAVEPWGGAAGSRGTTVTATLKDGRTPCPVSTFVTARIVDSDGEVVAAMEPYTLQVRPRVLLRPEDSLSFGVSWSNWCDDAPNVPLALEFVVGPSQETFSVPPVLVPPCVGGGEASVLNVTELQPAN